MGIAFGVLPVDWLDVNAKRVSNTHVISWNTAKEVNVSHYEVERKLDGDSDFTAIPGQISANGNTTQISNYSHVDEDVEKPGTYVYRVKQVDYDGLFTYSKLVKVSHNGQSSVEMYPNPARNETNIQVVVAEDASVMIELYDGTSRLVRVLKNADVQSAGEMLYHINLEDIAAGVYNVVVTIDGVTTQKKLIRIK
jgi:predicted Abi (CAAX) family protease